MIKKRNISILFCSLATILFGQVEKASECLELIKLSESAYIHSCNHNNGLVYICNQEALIVSTPDSDIETQHLIDRVKTKAKIVAYVIDRRHPDAMEGLDVVHKNDIRSYANERTRRIAKEKELPISNFGFDEALELTIGDQKVVCQYFGEAHTNDGIVVWIPSEQLLFGGNEIRNNGGWIGNIGDANLSEWSQTAESIRQHYGNAKIVVPGHGPHGGSELIDYTIDLYSFLKNSICNRNGSSSTQIQETMHDFQFVAAAKRSLPEKVIYTKGSVTLERNEKRIIIHADSIVYKPATKSVYAPKGCVRLLYEDRTESFSFRKLYAKLREAAIGMTLIIKEIN